MTAETQFKKINFFLTEFNITFTTKSVIFFIWNEVLSLVGITGAECRTKGKIHERRGRRSCTVFKEEPLFMEV